MGQNNAFGRFIDRCKRISGSSISRHFGVFLIFVVISALLWMTKSLNEEMRRDVQCDIYYTNVPDSVTFITSPPDKLTVNLKARGTRMFRYFLGQNPSISIDFRYYNRNGRLMVSRNDLQSLLQSSFGDQTNVLAFTPDSIADYFTTVGPLRLPVRNFATVSTTYDVALYGEIKLTTDSVDVYATDNVADVLTQINTRPVAVKDIGKDCVYKVPLAAPRGCRLIPDSVGLIITVEPILTKTMYANVIVENVPDEYEAILDPQVVEVKYRVPQSKKNDIEQVEVVADFASIPKNKFSGTIVLKPRTVNTSAIITRNEANFILRPVDANAVHE